MYGPDSIHRLNRDATLWRHIKDQIITLADANGKIITEGTAPGTFRGPGG